MDPNTALQTLRAFVAGVCEGDQPELIEMCETFNGLDEWLCKGGFRPAPWSHSDKAVEIVNATNGKIIQNGEFVG